ncbi:MAG: outer membrane beta-barrel protein [Bacteroidetes bacterium]|nr:outer membrane beta-barrel protein [Bacteroidota bacterium]
MKHFLAAFLLACSVMAVHAQDDAAPSYKHNRILIDVGLQLPQGGDATALGMKPGVGFALSFWQLYDEQYIGMLSFGSATMQLGTEVATDSGIQDLSGYSAQIVPLMGGVGYLFTGMAVVPYVVAEAGAAFLTLNAGKSRPIEGFNNEAYFAYGGRVGVGYPVSDHIALQVNVRYIKVATEQFSTLGVNGGISWSF